MDKLLANFVSIDVRGNVGNQNVHSDLCVAQIQLVLVSYIKISFVLGREQSSTVTIERVLSCVSCE